MPSLARVVAMSWVKVLLNPPKVFADVVVSAVVPTRFPTRAGLVPVVHNWTLNFVAPAGHAACVSKPTASEALPVVGVSEAAPMTGGVVAFAGAEMRPKHGTMTARASPATRRALM